LIFILEFVVFAFRAALLARDIAGRLRKVRSCTKLATSLRPHERGHGIASVDDARAAICCR
jgi:hypothetical protein